MIVLMVVRPHLISVFLAYDTNDNKRFVAIFSNGLLGKCCAQMSTRHFLMNLGSREFLFSDDRRSTSALTFLQGGLLLVVNGVTTPIRGRKQMAFTGVPIHPEKVELFHPTYSL